MVRADPEWLGGGGLKRLFHRQHRLSLCKASAIADAKYVRIYGKCFCAKGGIHHDIRGLSTYPGKRFERHAVIRHVALMIAQQLFGKRNDVFGLCVEQANGFDMDFQAILPERHHLRGRSYVGEQTSRGLVYADIGRLRRHDYGYQQLIGVGERKLCFWRGIAFGQPTIKLEDNGLLHRTKP